MKCIEVGLSKKGTIEKYLKLQHHFLAAYSFANIFIWRRLYQIFYTVVDDCLCFFFKDNVGCFAYLPPLGKSFKPFVVQECFRIMDRYNVTKALSRIENVERGNIEFYKSIGYSCEEKLGDYLYKRQDLASLKGERFKSKRAAFNYFVSNYEFSYAPFRESDKDMALQLYKEWARNRKDKYGDALYQGMIQDSYFCQVEAMENFKELGLLGRIVKVGGRISAYTIGFELNPDTFCILFEITDLSIKGLAQFIFRRLCEELPYEYINCMDDSGLENLRKVKLSYYPCKVIPSYIIKRPHV